ncbi:MAG: ATP-binding protein [Clostridia bacterium]|nr:ATP-binding protein [Clostridia bacterium]
MVRIVPRKTKVKLEFIRGFTGLDILLAVVMLAILIVLAASRFGDNNANIWVAMVWAILSFSMFFKIADSDRLYVTIGHLIRYSMQKKKYVKNPKRGKGNIKDIIPFEKIYQDRCISYGNYYAEVLEVQPILFGLLNEYSQNNVIDVGFGNALRRLDEGQVCEIVKINKAMVLDSYSYNENKKYDRLLDQLYEKQMSQEEIDARTPIFDERISFLEDKNRSNKIYKDFFYLVVLGKDLEALENTVSGMAANLATALTPVTTRRLMGAELAVFLRANYNREFNERDLESVAYTEYIDWAIPDKIKFSSAKYNIDGKNYRTYAITEYPLQVGNAWGASFFLLDRTKVVMKFKKAPKYESERKIDKAIMDMENKLYKTGKSSTRIEIETHLDTLRNLLAELKNSNQQLYDVNTFITCEDSARKDVKAVLKQEGFRYTEMFARQIDAFISTGISMRDNIEELQRGIPTYTLAGVFPFISSELQDENGFYIGDNEYPVFIDFFKRDAQRVNSNMMIIGKSGSGKSFATKTLLANFAADNTKIFICDPEKEYSSLSENLHGKLIDVGSSIHGIMNPFHVIRALDKSDDEDEKTEEELLAEIEGRQVVKNKAPDDSFNQHLQFLEQFFRTILEGISSDAFETINSCILDLYHKFNIDETTDLKNLKPTDYPTFDDLYALLNERLKTAKEEYLINNLRVALTYIRKFAKGGRNANLWNGPTSIETNENFVCFNFQSLLAGNNPMLTSAQMLLVFKYIESEVINNKDYNDLHKTNRKIIVVVDEAHLYINPKYPIALNFMTSMAKRIRKYGGMLIVITQNINDFVGSEEIKRQSTAVINACQYSIIFSLSPNDVNDLIELYKNSGGINKEERNRIVSASVGQAFVITSPTSRTMVQVHPLDYVHSIIEKRK